MVPAVAAVTLSVAMIGAPASEVIAQQLAAGDARTIAWGAYNAGAFHREDLIPRLQQILEAPPAISPSEEYEFIGVVMDALIQLNARVPARVLARYADQYLVQTFVLLPNATDRQNWLVAMLPRLSGFQWFAVADILIANRAPGLAEHLARTVRLRLSVVVADTDDSGVGEGIGGGSAACGIAQGPPDYPPHAEYAFAMAPAPGRLLLADGPQPLYYSRTVTATRQYSVSRAQILGPTDEERVKYLRAMSQSTAGVPFHADTYVTVRWSTAAALERRVRELRDDVERRFYDLIERASPALGGFTAPPIDVRLIDRRRDKSAPLPRLP